MKKFIAMLLAVTLMCSNIMSFDGSSTAYAAQNTTEENEIDTDVTSERDDHGESEEIVEQDTITAIHINPLYEDTVSEESIEFASSEYAIATLSEPEYVSDVNVIAETIREAMLERMDAVTVYYTQTGELGDNFLTDWLELAMIETDNPKAGDYLERHYSGAKASGSYTKNSSGVCKYTLTISFAYYTTAEQEAELDKEVDSVLNTIGVSNELTDYENAKKIYDYMCANITYDHANLNDDSYTLKYSAYAALINKTAVCQGYSSLFYYMARKSGLDVRIIKGTANNGVSTGRHGWNIIKLGDKYYYLDSTWDAGRTTYKYFLKGSDNFTGHMSDEQYTASEFTSAYPISETDYVPATIVESGNCGESATYTLDSEGTLKISGTGSISKSFKNRTDLKKLIINKGITEICSTAFLGCSKLTGDLVIPEGVTNIGHGPGSGAGGAFQGCSGLNGKLILPNSLQTIGYSTFENCSSFTGDLVIPDSVTYIDARAFYNCSGFDGTLVLSPNLDSVHWMTFYECTGFCGNLTIPEGIETIGGYAFYGCTGFNGELVLSDTLTSIGELTFCNCSGFTGNLIIPDSVISIGVTAFNGCSGFDGNLILSKKLTTIDDGTFGNCSGFVGNLIIPDSITYIDNKAFRNCSGFDGKLILSEHLSSISPYTFYGCTGFTGDLVIPDNVTSIGECAFYECGFTGSLVLSESLTVIGESAFEDCNRFTGDLKIPNLVTDIGKRTFWACSGFNGNLTISNSVAVINEWTFYGCSGLKGELYIPEYVTTIGANAFYGCSGFTGQLEIPNSVTYIGGDAFRECTGLTGDVIFPESVAYIGGGVLYKATGIDSVTVLNKNCEFPENLNFGFGEDVIVKGYCGSTTETFAKTYDNIFSPIHTFLSEWSKDATYHWHTATCEHTTEMSGKAEHVDENNDELCDVCSFKHEHLYTQENINVANALVSKATCTSPAVYYKSCICGKLGTDTFEYGAAKGHSFATEWSKDATYHWYAATCEHTTEVKERASHVDKNSDEICDVCKYDMHIHTYNQENINVANALVSKATCTKLAVYKTSCICGKLGTDTFEYGTLAEHTWGEWKISKQPTTNTTGLKRKDCTQCDAYKEQVIAKLVGAWVCDATGWWYRNADGTYPANSWKAIDGVWYYFNASGYMVTGWQAIGGTWYYFNGGGAMVTGWQFIGGTWYYLNGGGAMVTGWQFIGGTWYYFDGGGAMVTGWQAIGGTWYYFHGSGAMAANQWIGNYYLQADGSMAVNKRIGIYYVGADGAWVPGV